jgi:hypothetical protein
VIKKIVDDALEGMWDRIGELEKEGQGKTNGQNERIWKT